MGVHEVGRGDLAEGAGPDINDDASAQDRARTLRSLAGSLLAVAGQIDRESSPAAAGGQREEPAVQQRPFIDKQALLDRTLLDYSNRRQRSRFFPEDLFAEPAWDLLLDLFLARLEGKMITVTSACIAADVPVSTALRWISVLEAQGLVKRSRNVGDQRSTWVRLTDRAANAMIEYTRDCMTRSRRIERLADESAIGQF